MKYLSFAIVIIVSLLVIVRAAPSPDYTTPQYAKVEKLFRSPIQPNGCTHYVKGYDITGVTTEVDLTFKHDNIYSAFSCFHACAVRPTTCSSYVWKFTTDPYHRTCTLYSNFNLPTDVTLDYNVKKSINIHSQQLAANGNNPQAGSFVPACNKFNSTKHDHDCVSGFIFITPKGERLC